MRRDRRTVVLMIGLPVFLLVIFGYAARFDVTEMRVVVVGATAEESAAALTDDFGDVFDVVSIQPGGDTATARDMLRDSEADVALVTGVDPPEFLVDGTQLFVAQTALRQAGNLGDGVTVEVLFNPELDTATVMVPSLIGYILLFVGTVITSLGVVREREQGTLEQLAVTPLRSVDVIVGKIAPYFLVATIDLIIVTVVGLWLFDVPFRGSILLFAVFSLVFLFVVLGLGVLISTLSQNQGQAIQLSIMVLLPQIMMSGMIFPLQSMAAGVRWIGYGFPFTYFVIAMRAIMLKGSSASSLVVPLLVLMAMAIVVFGLAVLRFQRDLAPRQPGDVEADAEVNA